MRFLLQISATVACHFESLPLQSWIRRLIKGYSDRYIVQISCVKERVNAPQMALYLEAIVMLIH